MVIVMVMEKLKNNNMSSFTNSHTSMAQNKFAREEYLRTIEDNDERNGQAFECLEVDEDIDAREYKIMKKCESLANNGMHIVKIYV